MGETGMGVMMDMGTPENTLRMMSGKRPYGVIEMSWMLAVVKVRDELASYDDPGWYKHPPDTLPKKASVA
jgi:hypothetical protein